MSEITRTQSTQNPKSIQTSYFNGKKHQQYSNHNYNYLTLNDFKGQTVKGSNKDGIFDILQLEGTRADYWFEEQADGKIKVTSVKDPKKFIYVQDYEMVSFPQAYNEKYGYRGSDDTQNIYYLANSKGEISKQIQKHVNEAPKSKGGNGPGSRIYATNSQNGSVNINAGNGHDLIRGSLANDTLNGGGGNDTIFGLAGNDTIDGGDGVDTAVFDRTNFKPEDFSFDSKTGKVTLKYQGVDGKQYTANVSNVEYFRFKDGVYSLERGKLKKVEKGESTHTSTELVGGKPSMPKTPTTTPKTENPTLAPNPTGYTGPQFTQAMLDDLEGIEIGELDQYLKGLVAGGEISQAQADAYLAYRKKKEGKTETPPSLAQNPEGYYGPQFTQSVLDDLEGTAFEYLEEKLTKMVDAKTITQEQATLYLEYRGNKLSNAGTPPTENLAPNPVGYDGPAFTQAVLDDLEGTSFEYLPEQLQAMVSDGRITQTQADAYLAYRTKLNTGETGISNTTTLPKEAKPDYDGPEIDPSLITTLESIPFNDLSLKLVTMIQNSEISNEQAKAYFAYRLKKEYPTLSSGS